MSSTVTGRGKPKGFRLMDEGRQILEITKVTGLPRANVTNVEIEFVNGEGIPLKNKYDLTTDGGYAAFYYLVQNGVGVDLGDGDAFDIDSLLGKFIVVEIVHREGSKPREDGTMAVFANIKSTLGSAEGFDDEAASDAWED